MANQGPSSAIGSLLVGRCSSWLRMGCPNKDPKGSRSNILRGGDRPEVNAMMQGGHCFARPPGLTDALTQAQSTGDTPDGSGIIDRPRSRRIAVRLAACGTTRRAGVCGGVVICTECQRLLALPLASATYFLKEHARRGPIKAYVRGSARGERAKLHFSPTAAPRCCGIG